MTKAGIAPRRGRWRWVIRCAAPLALAGLLPATLGAQAPEVGTVAGLVLDLNGNPVAGAVVHVVGTDRRTESNRDGSYRIEAPVGAHSLGVEAFGSERLAASTEVEVTVGVTEERNLRINLIQEVVRAPLLQGQAKALNQQRAAVNIVNIVAADQIGRFPDPNAADASQRLPGVVLVRDQGEGRKLVIRGTRPQLNSTTINGERVATPDGGDRTVAMDVIPADLLEAVELTKALTPEMDADSIGGAVNLVTKLVPEEPRISATFGAGFNDIADDGILNGGVSVGRRQLDQKVGWLVAASAYRTDRGADGLEPEYDDGLEPEHDDDELQELSLRKYTIRRERMGLTAAADYRHSLDSWFAVHGIWNKFDDQEFRRQVVQAVKDGEITREIKDRLERERITSLVGSGNHNLPGVGVLDYRVGYTSARETEPGPFETVFKQEDVEFAPPDVIDPNDIRANPLNESADLSLLDGIERERNSTSQDSVVAAINLTLGLPRFRTTPSFFKFGGKVISGSKARNQDKWIREPQSLSLSKVLDDGFRSPDPFLGGRYDLGPFFDPARARLNFGQLLEDEPDPETDLADYEGSEDLLAAYTMAQVALGPRVTLLGGVRVERFAVSYEAKRFEDGQLGDVSGKSAFAHVLPSVHLRYALGDDLTIRAAVTRALARPDFEQLAPAVEIEEKKEKKERTIERGNIDLRPTTAWGYDLAVERFLDPVGVVSAGVFFKDLDGSIFDVTRTEVTETDDGQVTNVLKMPENAGSGHLFGLEFVYQNRLSRLPAPFDGLGVLANYTFTDSSSDVALIRTGDPTARLRQQARHTGNLAISYEKAGFSGRLAINGRSSYLSSLGGEAGKDKHVDSHTQLDLSAQHRLHDRASVFVHLNNLTNEPFRVFEGTPNRPTQEEFYKMWGLFGVKLDY